MKQPLVHCPNITLFTPCISYPPYHSPLPSTTPLHHWYTSCINQPQIHPSTWFTVRVSKGDRLVKLQPASMKLDYAADGQGSGLGLGLGLGKGQGLGLGLGKGQGLGQKGQGLGLGPGATSAPSRRGQMAFAAGITGTMTVTSPLHYILRPNILHYILSSIQFSSSSSSSSSSSLSSSPLTLNPNNFILNSCCYDCGGCCWWYCCILVRGYRLRLWSEELHESAQRQGIGRGRGIRSSLTYPQQRSTRARTRARARTGSGTRGSRPLAAGQPTLSTVCGGDYSGVVGQRQAQRPTQGARHLLLRLFFVLFFLFFFVLLLLLLLFLLLLLLLLLGLLVILFLGAVLPSAHPCEWQGIRTGGLRPHGRCGSGPRQGSDPSHRSA